MNFETLIYEKRINYALVTLSRPDKLNALNKQLFDDLDAVISDVANSNDIYALILTGSGEKAFAAGADIKELNACDATTGEQFSKYGSDVMARLEALDIPVIAAVNGFALGGGCELAMSCHIRFASDNAKFGQPEVNLGILPGYGGTQRLSRLTGKANSMELIISGNIINAEEAYRIGLVNKVFPQSELMAKTEEFVKLVLSKGPLAVKASVQAVNASETLSPAEGLAYESKLFGETCGTNDFKEGTSAFLEKRKADFKGN
ncbi:MAG: enoyl-CoA hydratase/isomerase family protein [Candidatus Kapabacteria bacterium]|nr:enoyl-CoA hydratase/isomerase family protein [Ignavibacteriota bacterium]MCW5885885.1 enoyl-CoA hydratase/isomerase family protein [Candidatus Kapabacteria bacterium]